MHHIEHILVTVQVKHIAYTYIALGHYSIIAERSSKRHLRLGDIELHTVDKVHETRGTKVSLTRVNGMGKSTNLLRHITFHAVYMRGKGLHISLIGFIAIHLHKFGTDSHDSILPLTVLHI